MAMQSNDSESKPLLNALRDSGFENLSFHTPWSARLFGMTLAANKKQLFTLQQFQKVLIERISEFENKNSIISEDDYYTCWLESLQTLLEEKNLWQADQLSLREKEVSEAAAHRHDEQKHKHHKVKPITVK